ncbi:dickkopf-related protein 1 [Hemicordylus capensis]|uniref:dickkopf-related protein 1 n=1 Tax=Hemicordylus capensis TaxID=884348 RepID=UPI0023045E83|nr:dickkopf-related protein 1 [Hemicordylus capensis]
MMPLCGPEGACRLFAVLVAAFCFSSRAGGVANAALSANMQLSSNAIKNLPPGGAVASAGSPVSAAPGSQQLLNDGGNKHPTGDSQQPFACTGDEDCNADEFCSAPAQGAGIPGGQVCLACRRRRKRCLRDAMCCPGNYCSNGICVPLDHNFNPGEIEETIVESFDHGTLDPHLKKTTSSSRLHHLKGQEGAICLRSSDCATGLCCARHFWSKICKPVLKEGQVCTKHRKKGSHGLEIFQRCYCGDGLACRLQRDHTLSNSANSSRLHTCQRH